jgi:hypothetical protein
MYVNRWLGNTCQRPKLHTVVSGIPLRQTWLLLWEAQQMIPFKPGRFSFTVHTLDCKQCTQACTLPLNAWSNLYVEGNILCGPGPGNPMILWTVVPSLTNWIGNNLWHNGPKLQSQLSYLELWRQIQLADKMVCPGHVVGLEYGCLHAPIILRSSFLPNQGLCPIIQEK